MVYPICVIAAICAAPSSMRNCLNAIATAGQPFVMTMHEIPLEHHGKTLDIQHGQPPDLQLHADRMRRQEADPHASDNPPA